MAPAYKVEELLAMRDSVSESAVSIDKFHDEDSIKEHVLRSSASTSGVSLRPSASLSTLGGQRASKPSVPVPGAPVRSEFPYSNDAVPTSVPSFPANHFDYAPANPNAYGTSAIKKPSPTPSVRKNKAEQLLKEHASPPGRRVTAGGHIVPADITSLGSPLYPVKQLHNSKNSDRMSRPQQNSADSQPERLKNLPNGQVFLDQTTGVVVQLVDGQIMPVRNSNGIFQPQIVPPNWSFSELHPASAPFQSAFAPVQPMMMPYPYPMPTNQMAHALPIHTAQTFGIPASPNVPQNSPPNNDDEIDIPTQIDLLDKQYKKLEAQKREVEQTEVIRERNMDPATKSNFVKQKRSLTIELDKIRKHKKELQAQLDRNLSTQRSFPNMHDKAQIGSMAPYAMGQAYQYPYGPVSVPVNTLPVRHDSVMSVPNGFNMYQSGDQLYPLPTAHMQGVNHSQMSTVDFMQAPSLAYTGSTLQSHSNASIEGKDSQATPKANVAVQVRRSHALEIRDPQKVGDRTQANGPKSSLNPTSPSYKPSKPLTPEPDGLPVFLPQPPPSPSPIASPQPDEAFQAQHPWLCGGTTHPSTDSNSKAPSTTDGISNSSISTADFFPINTAEYSSTKYALSKENQNVHVTPEKGWPNTPWNSQLCSPDNESTHKSPARPTSPITARMSSWTRDCNPVPESPGIPLSAENQRRGQAVDPIGTPLKPLSTSMDDRQAQQAEPVKTSVGLMGIVGKLVNKSPSYQDGYHAGLRRDKPSLEKDPHYVQGYCAGLIDSSPDNDRTTDQQRQTSFSSVPSKPSDQRPSYDQFTPPNSAVGLQFLEQQIERDQFSQENVHAPPPSFASYQGEMQRSDTRTAPMNGRAPPSRRPSGTSDQEQRIQSFNNTFISPQKSSGSYAKQADEVVTMAPLTRQCSGNQMPSADRGASTTFVRQYPGNRVYNQQHFTTAPMSLCSIVRPSRDRAYQMDGAMDDLAEMVAPVPLAPASGNATSSAATSSPTKVSRSSPSKTSAAPTTEAPSSPSKSGSPKKSGSSPEKPRLERVVDRLRGSRRGEEENKENNNTLENQDPATMSGEDKKRWRRDWCKRFRDIKKAQQEEIQRYKQEHPTPTQ